MHPPTRPLHARRLAAAGPLLLLLCAGFTNCGGGEEVASDADSPAVASPYGAFDGERAWDHLRAQVELGPRPAGSDAGRLCREYIVSELAQLGLEPREEAFTARAPSTTGLGVVRMANVVLDLPARDPLAAPIVILGAHYDTKRWTKRAPRKRASGDVLGANDGASGVALLLELTRVLAEAGPQGVTWRIVFFDGEESFRWDWEDPDNRYGSKHHTAELGRTGQLERVAAMVLFDMVADADLEILHELYSERELYQVFVRAADQIGLGDVIAPGRGQHVADDHLSFLEVGIPSLDVIDFRYPDYANGHWHSDRDTLEHVSAESLQRVGHIAVAALPGFEAWALR